MTYSIPHLANHIMASIAVLPISLHGLLHRGGIKAAHLFDSGNDINGITKVNKRNLAIGAFTGDFAGVLFSGKVKKAMIEPLYGKADQDPLDAPLLGRVLLDRAIHHQHVDKHLLPEAVEDTVRAASPLIELADFAYREPQDGFPFPLFPRNGVSYFKKGLLL